MLKKYKQLSPLKQSLIFLGIGVLILLLIFPYHFVLHLGVQPCKGLPSDPSNCGDADFSGLIFVMLSLPFLFAGSIATVGILFVKGFNQVKRLIKYTFRSR